HFGDNQAVDMELEVAANGKDIQPVRINIGNFEWPKVSAYFWNQRNPAIYLSSGKHHAYFSRSWDKKKSPYGKFCSDNVNGKGAIVLPTLEDPLVPRGRLNVGEPESHPRSSFVGDLSFAGFFYEDAWGKTPFCGGYQS